MADSTLRSETIHGIGTQLIEADESSDYANDTDSIGSDLASISSSVLNYQYENGRRYHAYRAGKYILPNDELEQNRLDLVHHVFRLSLDGNVCYSKLENPLNILDVGTGTGIWAIDMGDLYPSARVIGTDISPIQPDWVPPNVTFQVDDATDKWTFPPNHFDLIHVRCLCGSVRDWPKIIKQAYEHLRPGGKLEVVEGRTHLCCDDGSYSKDSQTYRWLDEFHKIARSHGLEFDPFPQVAGMLRQTGFENIIEDERPCPVGGWPKDRKLKEIGKFFKHQFINAAVDSYSTALFTRLGGWSETDTQALLAAVKEELNDKNIHVYTHCSYAIGEKPS